MQYKVSVVTPFHNVEDSIFKNCVQSVFNQSIGFENLEWIVVFHNCKQEYIDSAKKHLAGYGNVKMSVLDNSAHTPSSPRNHGTALATAPYLSYLDADDSLTENCLEVALREAVATHSQVVWFRRELEKEDPTMVMPATTSFCDNTMERVIIEKGNWDYKIMFSGLFGFSTSFLFNLGFLRSKNLTFSDKMLFCEDFLFVVQVLTSADRICYLPQHIGYHYYVNGDSLVQHMEKTADELIQYAEGFRDMYALMRSYGIDSNENSQIMGSYVAKYILASPSLTVGDRLKIKQILGPDVSAMVPIPADKNFDAKTREIMMYQAQDVILNPDNPGKFILKVRLDSLMELRDIIRENMDTDFARHYNFRQVKSVNAYQFLVPLTDWDYYRKIIPIQTNVGDRSIFTTRHIKRYFQKHDGTLIPSTKFNCHKYADCFASLLQGRKSILVAWSMPVVGITNDNAEIDNMYSGIVKDYFSEYYLKQGVMQAGLTSPVITYFRQDRSETYYMDIMTDALAHSDDVEQIVAFDTRELLQAFSVLENRWQEMVVHIADEKRRNEVIDILSKGFNKPVAQKLWPRIERIIAFGTGEFYKSATMLKRFVGELPYNNGFYFTEETILGKAVADNSDLFECIQNYNFYELLPVDSADNPKPLTWSQVETGKAYYLLVTNHAGLYRYNTKHVIMPVNVSADNIQFKVC